MRKVTPAKREPSALVLVRCSVGLMVFVNTNSTFSLPSSWMMRWASSMRYPGHSSSVTTYAPTGSLLRSISPFSSVMNSWGP